ncbi:MAG: helix-turn-helix transcriptional regulator [Sphingosinicella sp.]|nr:helix-turn-helix transcriptional regulator [Sphingosinicella sp.]
MTEHHPLKLQRIEAGSALSWHSHEAGYAAVVIGGDYVEAGDGGRHRAAAGHVIVHAPFTGHANRIGTRGAEVVNIDLSVGEALSLAGGTLTNPIEFVRELHGDSANKVSIFAHHVSPAVPERELPDMLARALDRDSDIRLSRWADQHGMSPRTITRQFSNLYGISPAHYRWRQRALAAWRAIMLGDEPLVRVANDTGFADQAHMTRSVLALTGRTPFAWRSHPVRFVQD